MISKRGSITIAFDMAHKNESNWSPYLARKKEQGRAPITGQKSNHKKLNVKMSFAEADDRMLDIFKHHGFGHFPHPLRHKLVEFYFLLMQEQSEQNFTRLLSLRDVAIKHFIDSLLPTELHRIQFPLMDMGTGAGFPGIPIAIANPDQTVGLAEGVQKRVEFLKKARTALGLKNLPILGRNINSDFYYPFRSVITRAVEDASNTLGNCIHCLPVGGQVLLLKGPQVDPEIQPALEKWGNYYELVKDIPYQLPETPHQRRMLVFVKIKHLLLPDDLTEAAWQENASPEDHLESQFIARLKKLNPASFN